MKHFWIITICCLIWSQITRCQVTNLTFPENFIIGAASASYQIEGSWNVGDKGESVWDHFVHNRPELIEDGTNGDIACDSYNQYEVDVKWLKDIGLDYYRFSLSWTRILPNGFADTVSEDGIQYYKNLIQALLANNIQPAVTLYHWDHPQALEELGGWTNDLMVDWFADYARIVFRELGPLGIKTFVTINEPAVFCTEGYTGVRKAPGKLLENFGHYMCVHNVLKAHAKAYHIYDEEFRPTQQGKIGLTASCDGWVRGEDSTDASMEQAFLFNCGWIMNPIYIGDYPEIMKTRIANISAIEGYPFSRLPQFSEEWIATIKGTADFFGVNSYTSGMPAFDPDDGNGKYTSDNGLIITKDPSWLPTASPWFLVVPAGFGNLLRMISNLYGNPPVRILENGYSDNGELDDYARIDFFHQYLTEVLNAIYLDGCNIEAYTIWSLTDNFEWNAGYKERFGIVSVNFTDPDRPRTAKRSTAWWQEVLRTRILQDVPTATGER